MSSSLIAHRDIVRLWSHDHDHNISISNDSMKPWSEDCAVWSVSQKCKHTQSAIRMHPLNLNANAISSLMSCLTLMTNLVDKYESSIFNVSRMRLNFLSAAIENVEWCARSDDDGRIGSGRSIFSIHCNVDVVWCWCSFGGLLFLCLPAARFHSWSNKEVVQQAVMSCGQIRSGGFL